ncbi:MAG: proline--tRNA ligase [Candidatus Cloacimonetes bacterium]|nr:proline--tRNA ligase [Candidatus Cloacimonadota bacterium]
MRYSQLFGKTTKTIPADAQLVNHKLLVQGGFVRRISVGRWAFLPLGMRVWEKIYQIIDKEMKAIGCQKLVVPTLHPIEIWQATARDQAFGEEMLVVDDHHGATFAIGATAEGVMVELIKMFSPSYKDLPLEIYQFSQKFRDDKRPRGGIMRVREFMMKDAYNFAASEEQFMESYQKFYDAYLRIAERLGLPVTPVLADSGAIGGSLSHEFQVESSDGDQTYFICDKCGYAANIEKAEFARIPLNPEEEIKPFEIIPQPEWVCTMEDNLKHYGQPLWRYLKNVVYKDEKGRIIIASTRGDQSVNEIKLKKVLQAESLEPATEKDLAKIGTKPGYVHSWGIHGVTFIGDLALPMVKNYIGGQKEKETDSANVNYGRDFNYEILADIVDAKDGGICSKCKKGKLRLKKGFEWGHCFKIEHFYTKPQEGYFTDQDDKRKPLWMGSYGIGTERTMACIVETHHDEKGIIWPESVAPCKVHLLAIGEQKEVYKGADTLYQQLLDRGVEVLYDDRVDVSAGEKFADADLIGIPIRLVLSEKTLAKNSGEIKMRNEDKTELVSVDKLSQRFN